MEGGARYTRLKLTVTDTECLKHIKGPETAQTNMPIADPVATGATVGSTRYMDNDNNHQAGGAHNPLRFSAAGARN